MKEVVKFIGLGVILIVAFSCNEGKSTGIIDDTEVPAKIDQYPGLSVSSTGELLLNGESYHGIGVNYFNAFTRTLEDGHLDDDSYRTGFSYLKERKIPFVRFSLNGYWPKNWDVYQYDEDRYFQNLDAFVESAEEFKIGLIPSFFWHTPTLPDLVNESVNHWGNTNSKTHMLMREFIRKVVMRYRESPAIWGWEQGNEVNLAVDLPGDNDNLPPVVPSLGTPSSRSKEDKLNSSDLIIMMKAFANEIRKYDESRIIITGNSTPRFAAWHLLHNQQWTADSRKQYIEMLAFQNPDPIDVLCIHSYPATAEEGYFFEDKIDMNGLIMASMEASRLKNKPLFLEEWGAQESKYRTQTKEKFLEILNAIEANGVPLSSMWVFDYPPHDIEEGINVSPDNGPREYMLQEIMKVNQRFANW